MVLIVEILNRDFVAEGLDAQTLIGMVQAVQSGSMTLEAFQWCLQQADYLMPEMKGDQLVALIRQRRPQQRIIMATAFAEDFLVAGEPARGVDSVLKKPFSLADLRAAVAKVTA